MINYGCEFAVAGLFSKSSQDVTSADGAFYSNGAQLGVQLLGVLVTVTWSVLWTYVMTWLIRLTVSVLSFGFVKFNLFHLTLTKSVYLTDTVLMFSFKRPRN